MAYNPGVQDRSGEILAQGISQGFSSLARGIELGAQRRKEKEDEIKTSNAALKSFESTMKGLVDAGMMKPEILNSITDARGMDSKGRMEFVTRGFQSLPAFLSANQIQTERAKNEAALEQNRLAQQDFANINAPTQSLVQNQMGMGASFEQLSQGPGAFQQGTPDLNAKIQRVYAAPNIDPDKKPGIINALIAQNEAGKPAKPQNLGFNEQAVAEEIAAQQASLGRALTPAERSAIYREVAGRTNPAETEYAKKVGGAKAEADTKLFEGAIGAQDNLIKIDETLRYLEKSDAVTGMGAEILNNLNRVKSLLNQQNAAGKKVTDTEMLNSLLGSEVFSMMGSLGVGARGLDTPAEREFLREVMTGTIGNNKETLIRLTNLRKDREERAIERYNTSIDDGTLDDFFKSSKRPKTKIKLLPKEKPLFEPLSPKEKARLIELQKNR